MLVPWNNWNTIIPSFVFKHGIIFQEWNNLSTVRNIPSTKLFQDLVQLQQVLSLIIIAGN
jgi:hypothetical protein